MTLTNRIRDAVRAWLLPETRTSLENPSTPLSYPAEWLLDIFNGGRTDSGIRVSEMTALQVSTVFACVKLISGTIASLPLHVFELQVGADQRRGKRVAHEHPIYELLRWEPNEEMTAHTFRQTLQSHMLLWGNGYAEIQRDQGNRPVAIWPRNPARTRPYRLGSGKLVYKTTEGMEEQTEIYDAAPPQAGERTIAAEDVLHIPGLSLDGRVGQSVVQLARQAVGLALATEKFGSKFFGNGARPGGILQHPGVLKPEAREQTRRSWQEAQGGENAWRIALLENGVTFKEVGFKPEEGQFLQTRQFQKAEICAIFNVPPHMVGDTEKSNRANTEQISLEFLNYCIGEWIDKWEQEARRKLFPDVGRTAGKFFPKFETRRLTMPDADSRRNFYASGKQWGYLSTNDIHEFEDLNPIDDPAADAYWMPVNMQEMGSPPKPQPGNGGPGEPQAEPSGDKASLRQLSSYRRLFRDAIGRALARRNGHRTADRLRLIFEPLLAAIAEDLAGETAELDEFLGRYLEELITRAADWTGADAEDLAERELARALKTIAAQKQLLEVNP